MDARLQSSTIHLHSSKPGVAGHREPTMWANPKTGKHCYQIVWSLPRFDKPWVGGWGCWKSSQNLNNLHVTARGQNCTEPCNCQPHNKPLVFSPTLSFFFRRTPPPTQTLWQFEMPWTGYPQSGSGGARSGAGWPSPSGSSGPSPTCPAAGPRRGRSGAFHGMVAGFGIPATLIYPQKPECDLKTDSICQLYVYVFPPEKY